MTVAELITKLRELPPDARVMVRAYEGGYDDMTQADPRPIALNVRHDDRWQGDHDDAEHYPDADVVTAVVIE